MGTKSKFLPKKSTELIKRHLKGNFISSVALQKLVEQRKLLDV